jgi:hypothetical protein
MGPRLQDYTLVVVSALFMAGGLLIASSPDNFRGGLAVTVFFGGCLAIGVWILVEKIRLRDGLARPMVVGAVPGVRIPMSRARVVVPAVALTLGGAVMSWAGQDISPLFAGVSLFIFVVGVFLLVALLTGRIGDRWIAFEPEGLRFGNRRFTYLVAWDNLVAAEPYELSDNPLIALHLRSTDALLSTLEGTPRERLQARLARQMRNSESLHGVPLLLWASHFRLDTAATYRALMRYALDPTARKELAPPPSLPGG